MMLMTPAIASLPYKEHYLKDAPVQTEVITGKALEQYNGRSLDEILSALSPSITFSPGDMGSNIQLNGLKNDYILIMVNGNLVQADLSQIIRIRAQHGLCV